LIPHSRPTLDERDAAAVARVVRSGQIAHGPEAQALERELAARLGVAAAAVVSSGSAALELGLRALGIGAGDDVLIPTYACDALHHAVRRAGARPILVDADPHTSSLSVADAKRRLTPRARAIVVVHAFGLAVDVRPFDDLGLPVLEDCAQALGAAVDGRPAGSRGAVGVCSFYATKLLTTGEGGAVVGPAGPVRRVVDWRDYDEREDLGERFNYKLTDLQAALGRSQLARLDAFLTRRRAIAARYRARLAGARCALPPDAGERHVYHRFVIGVERPVEEVIARLEDRGIGARRPVFRPIHRALGLTGYAEADRLWSRLVSLPCYPSLRDEEVDLVARAVGEALAA
jgi:dTDP-4-amino-4,6-dideoxygalactose transaminase